MFRERDTHTQRQTDREYKGRVLDLSTPESDALLFGKLYVM